MASDPFSLRARLARREAEGLYRRRRVLERVEPAGQGVRAIVDGRELLSFCSNDYLGLAQHPAVTAALVAAATRHGVGSGASHLVSGHHREHHALEEALAAFTGRERALLFSSGYMANLAVASALVGRGDYVLEDRLNHASLIDAARLSGARLLRYAHGDAAALEARLVAGAARPRLVLSDGVFSMDGDLAPLPALATACRRHDAWLVVDDAHGLGVMGARGRGSLEEFALGPDDVPVLVGTLGKALGTFGAFVAGDRDLIEHLIQSARTYLYTTALPPALAAATRAALALVDEEAWRRERVRAHVARFRRLAADAGLALMDSNTPIQPLVLGPAAAATTASDALLAQGILVTAIRPPTVPAGSSRLRITLSAEHTDDDIDRLVEALALAPGARHTPGTSRRGARGVPGTEGSSDG